jgi:hypothetical protein
MINVNPIGGGNPFSPNSVTNPFSPTVWRCAMAEIINFDKVTTLLLQHGEWYEVDPGTLTSIHAADFLSGHSGTNAFAWESRGARLACPCSAVVLVRYST